MNILAIDTSTKILSIAVKTDESYEERLIDGHFSHSEDLLHEIKQMCARASVALRDLDLLICTKGPGSFTGLRVGMATLKGIRSASGAKLVSIPTLSAMINTVSAISDLPVLAVMDAKKKRYYIRLEDKERVIVSDIDANAEDIKDELSSFSKILVVGDYEKIKEDLKKAAPSVLFVHDPKNTGNISMSLIELGLIQLEEKGEDEIGMGPVYIRKSDAEVSLEKRIKEGF